MADDDFIPYTRHWLDDDDIAAVAEVLRSGWLTQGPAVAAFEAAIAKRAGAAHGIAVANGTAALHAACHAAGVGPGDEIITTPLTFAASGNCALYLGAGVAFADIDPDSFLIDPERLEAAITPRTKAIIPVDFTGQPCDMDAINAIAGRHGITVIEDAAHALGAAYKGRPMGSLAAMTTFSFHPAKHVATGEGGMVVTDDEDLAQAMRRFRSHGIVHEPQDMLVADEAGGGWYQEMQDLGFNYRITDIHCALGLSQLQKLDGFLARRRAITARYDQAFGASPLLRTPFQADGRESAWHLYMLRLDLARMTKTRRQVFDELRGLGIGVHVHYIPLHLHPYYRHRFGHKRGDFPMAEAFYDQALTIPLYPAMTDAQVERVIHAVLETVA